MTEIRVELPDFEEFYEVANKIKNNELELENLKLNVEKLEKDIIIRAMGDETYYLNGKAPSMDFLRNTYKVTGFAGELVPLREKIIELDTEDGYLKRRYEILKLIVEVWRTESSNARSALSLS
jgi:hypothetical protein